MAAVIESSDATQSQIIFMVRVEMDECGEDKCCTLYVSVSQIPGLNRGDSVHWGVWTLSLPEIKGKGRGKCSSQVTSRAIICSGSRAQEKRR